MKARLILLAALLGPLAGCATLREAHQAMVTPAPPAVVERHYDAQGRLTGTTIPRGSGRADNYDAQGRFTGTTTWGSR